MSILDRLLGRAEEAENVSSQEERKETRERLDSAKRRHRENLARSNKVLKEFHEIDAILRGEGQ